MEFDVIKLLEKFQQESTLIKTTDGQSEVYVFGDGKKVEVMPARKFSRSESLGSVAGFCEHVKRWLDPADTHIKVSSSGALAEADTTGYPEGVVRVSLPFFKDDMPLNGNIQYDELLAWLDRHSGKITGYVGERAIDEESVIEAIKQISYTEKKETTVEDRGASTAITMKMENRVEPVKAVIPKKLVVEIRFGLREYEIPVAFRLRVNKDLTFSLTHLDRDGAVETYIARLLADLKAGLGNEWEVVQGA